MHVINGLTRVLAGVEDQSIPILRKPLLMCQLRRAPQKLSKKRRVTDRHVCDGGNVLFGNQKNVDRRCRTNIVKGDELIILKDHFGRRFMARD